MSPTSARQSVQAVTEEQVRTWLEQADGHYQRAAELNADPASTRRAELELELARYAKERSEDLADPAGRLAADHTTASFI
ncbi:hypothetical protein ACGF07_31810 [Kitasatospora sp. NPDC048194]|uniref:hypothetical protein n=1 Tax=Kitasatospora sp. NPDC048194 TaxID=3364045 RepID=UPI0037133C18